MQPNLSIAFSDSGFDRMINLTSVHLFTLPGDAIHSQNSRGLFILEGFNKATSVYIYINFSQSTTILLVYIMFIIYNIRATSFGFMPSSGPL